MDELGVMASIELHVNATCYAQHPALKSVYGKDQPVSYCPPRGQCLLKDSV